MQERTASNTKESERAPVSYKEMMHMSIFTGLFKSRDKPKDSYDSPSYSYFFG